MKIKIVLLLLFVATFARAQDPVFTSYFVVPETLNPGFAGILETLHAGVLHRTQWPNGDRQIDTDYAFLNGLIGQNAAVGGNVISNREKFTNYSLTQVNAVYSYQVEVGDEWYFRPGIEAGYGIKHFDFDRLILEDQIDRDNGAIDPSSVDPAYRQENIKFVDVSAGFVFNTEKAWIGASLKHLNRPNISFSAEADVPLEMFLSVHGLWKYDFGDHPALGFLPKHTHLLLTGNYMMQGEYNRLDLGIGMVLETTAIRTSNALTFGATMSANPKRTSDNSHLLTSVNPFVSVTLSEFFMFNAAYDFSTSRLGNTHGVYELSLTYRLREDCWKCRNRKVR